MPKSNYVCAEQFHTEIADKLFNFSMIWNLLKLDVLFLHWGWGIIPLLPLPIAIVS